MRAITRYSPSVEHIRNLVVAPKKDLYGKQQADKINYLPCPTVTKRPRSCPSTGIQAELRQPALK